MAHKIIKDIHELQMPRPDDPKKLAKLYAHELLNRVMRGFAAPHCEYAIRKPGVLYSAAALCHTGEHLVKQEPEFRAALWLLHK